MLPTNELKWSNYAKMGARKILLSRDNIWTHSCQSLALLLGLGLPELAELGVLQVMVEIYELLVGTHETDLGGSTI